MVDHTKSAQDHAPSKALGLPDLIHPLPTAEFFQQYFEFRPAYIRRDATTHFADLLTLDDIDRLLNHSNFRTTEVFVVDAARKVSVEDFTNAAGAIDPAKIFRLHAEGSTIILNRINKYHPPLADLCATMDVEFGATCGANVYVTPPNAQGFQAHFDTHDVFILQLHGTKRWNVYGNPVEMPVAGHGEDGPQDDPGPTTAQFDLSVGDTLYIPRGIVHSATSHDDVSVHVTLGIFSFTWADLLLECLASEVLKDPTYRRSVPKSFMLSVPDPKEARATFDGLIEHFQRNVDLTAAMHSLREQFIARRGTSFRGQMSQLANARRLTDESHLIRRRDLVYSLGRDAGQFRLRCYGSEVQFPSANEDVLLFALNTSSFRIKDMPRRLVDGSTIGVMQRLIRAGALKVDDADGSGSDIHNQILQPIMEEV